MKQKIKLFIFMAIGLFLLISGISEWIATGFMWGGNHTPEGESGAMNLGISITGLVFMAYGYIEYDNHKPDPSDGEKK